MITGRRVSWARMSARISMPSRPGRARSSRIRSKGCSPIRWRPASPVGAVSTAKPSISSRVCKDSRISASSSMMSTAPARPGDPGVPFNSEREITAVSDMERLPAQGEVESESCAGAGMTLHANLAGMFLDDAVGDGKAEAGAAGLAFARSGLGGEEGIVDALDVLGSNARSGVGNTHADAVAVHCGNTQCAAARHGVFGVQEQIQEHLLQSSRISLNGRQLGSERVLHLDFRHFELVLQKRKSVADDFVHIDVADLVCRLLLEKKKIIHNLRRAENLPR